MKELSPEKLEKWKKTFADMGVVYDNDDDYREAVHNLVGYFDILIQMDLQQKTKKNTDSQTLL